MNGRAPAAAWLALVFALTGAISCERQPESDAHAPREVGQPPQRIVTLAPNLTEIIAATGCGERLVGIDDHSDFPPQVLSIPRVGGMNPSVERILALDPDVVLAPSAGRYASLAPVLREHGVTLRIVTTDRLSQLTEEIQRLGSELQCPGAVALAREVDTVRTNSVEQQDAPSALLLASWEPLYVAGHETFADDLLHSAGLRNAVEEGVTGWPLYSLESVLDASPDLIFVLSAAERWPATKAAMESAPGWSELDAVKSGRLFMIDEDLASRAGPRVPQVQRKMREFAAGADRP